MVVAVLAFGAWYGIGHVAAGVLTQPERRFDASNNPSSHGSPAFETLTLTTSDGIDIASWFLPVPGSDAGIVLVHGHESSRTRELSSGFPELAASLQANGYQVLMIDLRGHGVSGGERFSFGRLERLDVFAAVDHLLANGVAAGQVGVLGVSMGAATAIGAIADDARIGALWADSGYADIKPIIETRWPRASGLPMIFLEGALLAHRVRFGYDLAGVRPEEEIVRVPPRPIQLVHGTADATVPYDHALRLQAASGADLWTLPGVAHAGIYPLDPAGYTARVVAFFDAALRVKVALIRERSPM